MYAVVASQLEELMYCMTQCAVKESLRCRTNNALNLCIIFSCFAHAADSDEPALVPEEDEEEPPPTRSMFTLLLYNIVHVYPYLITVYIQLLMY